MGSGISIPDFKSVLIPLGIFFPLFGMLVMMGASNAVNLTDGLDGLAMVPTIIVAGVFALIAYLVGNRIFAGYLELPFVAGSGELTVFCSALIGAGLGFLWFNAPPAAVFMGDTGSLALGGAVASVAVATKHEIVLAIVGGLFVVETLSVIIQVFWFKRTGRRVFLMAPLHHHFEKKGWAEPTIVIRFWIVSMILALIRSRDLEDPMTGFPANLFAGARYAILGLGRNGLPAARSLRAMGAEVVLWDDGEAARMAAATEGFTLRDLSTGDFAFDALVLSRRAFRMTCPNRIRWPPAPLRTAFRFSAMRNCFFAPCVLPAVTPDSPASPGPMASQRRRHCSRIFSRQPACRRGRRQSRSGLARFAAAAG